MEQLSKGEYRHQSDNLTRWNGAHLWDGDWQRGVVLGGRDGMQAKDVLLIYYFFSNVF